MTKITIGGTVYEMGELKFASLKRAWPHIQKNQKLSENPDEADPIESMESAIAIVSAGLLPTHPDMTPEKIEEDITAKECSKLDSVIVDMMVEAGFMETTKTGEDEPEEVEAIPSTESSTK